MQAILLALTYEGSWQIPKENLTDLLNLRNKKISQETINFAVSSKSKSLTRKIVYMYGLWHKLIVFFMNKLYHKLMSIFYFLFNIIYEVIILGRDCQREGWEGESMYSFTKKKALKQNLGSQILSLFIYAKSAYRSFQD